MSNWKQSRQLGDWLLLANGIILVVLVNLIASSVFFRIDLTGEKRYTIKAPTKMLLRDLDDHVYIEVFLEGDLNPGFRRFRKSVGETLEEFRIYSNNKVHYTFTDPALARSDKARNEFMAEVLNQSIEGIEFEFANAIQKLTNTGRKRVGLLKGHGELDSLSIAGLNNALLEQYDVFNVDLPRKKGVFPYDVLIVPKPVKLFSEADKFKLDQYIMTGGKVIFLIDRQDAVMDSASRNNYYAFPVEVNLDDQLFKYGVRINRDLIQDRVAGKYPVVVGEAGGRPQLMPLDWPWFPLINHYADHPITRNLDATLTRFISSMDTVKAIGVKKTALLFTSPYSRKATIPVKIDIDDVRKELKREDFQEGPIPVAYLLEGEFTSLYKNRFLPADVDTGVVVERSKRTKIIVVADGDVARNDVNPRSGQAQALGLDLVSGYTFANQDLLLNMVAYLVEENGVISTRNKEAKIMPLDKERIRNRSFWQVVNLVLPVIVLILFGLGRMWRRKRKYTSF